MTFSDMAWPDIPRPKGRRIYRFLFRRRMETETGRASIEEIAAGTNLSKGDVGRHLTRYDGHYWYKQTETIDSTFYIAYHPGEMDSVRTNSHRFIIRK